MKAVPVLQTARLIMRGIDEEDTGCIVKLRSDPNVYKYFISAHKITEDEHLKWYKNNYLNDSNRIDWIAFDAQKNVVGIFGIKRDTKDSKEAEVSYILSPQQYGKGYASEAVTRLIQFCKEEWQCNSVTAEVHEDNVDSIRFAEKLGFICERQEGRFVHYKKSVKPIF